ncbi:bacterial regulatory, arsR family protein [Collimonas arenae]|uniref:Bacterial regulatory, arsR family protein n=1 Tax=Collimonas arenae TaxID=279058 RepID=A0A127QG21_9BURK|nr:helix-turn-helix transcriptional regulator [Collimonas arenae]AMP09007.1 bacterial regulatory, arsR family protein [Collimonas arenae]
MHPQPNISAVAFLIADPARAAMLMTLCDGRALPAGELAHAAGVTAQTASAHLGKLLDGGLLLCEQQGRHRYYRLANSQVAQALEQLAAINPTAALKRKPLSRTAQDLRLARCCYDHLAGQVGVALTQALQERGLLVAGAGKRFDLSEAGIAWFAAMGVDIGLIKPGRYGLARQCLDWTERAHHLAGPLGVRLMAALSEAGWLRRSSSSRVVQITPKGWAGLKAQLGIDQRSVEQIE